jgi:cytochrome c oxidase subunit III
MRAVFLDIKGLEYRAEFHEHLMPGPLFKFRPDDLVRGAQVFFFLYFVTTGLHADHLGIVVIAVISTAWRV